MGYNKATARINRIQKKCATAKKTFKSKKREYFKRFAGNLNFRANPTYVWNICKILNKSWVKTSSTSVTEKLQNEKKIDNALNKLCPPWAQTNPFTLPKSQNNEFFDVMY